MKRKLVILTICFVIGSCLAVVAYADPLNYVSFTEPQNQFEQEIKQEIEQRLTRFKNEVDSDILSSSDLSLDGYTLIDNQTFYTDETYKPVAILISKEVIMQQENGDIIPSVYINGDNGYVLEKKADGTNHIYYFEFNQEEQKWQLEKIHSAQGKVMLPED